MSMSRRRKAGGWIGTKVRVEIAYVGFSICVHWELTGHGEQVLLICSGDIVLAGAR